MILRITLDTTRVYFFAFYNLRNLLYLIHRYRATEDRTGDTESCEFAMRQKDRVPKYGTLFVDYFKASIKPNALVRFALTLA